MKILELILGAERAKYMQNKAIMREFTNIKALALIFLNGRRAAELNKTEQTSKRKMKIISHEK